MDVGQNGLHQLGLDQHWGEEIQLAQLAADTSFDVLWSVEHHFRVLWRRREIETTERQGCGF
jgi:hypothetical protein